ncbi:MAG: hypothetical protein ACI4JC_03450 [Faecalibacterium sp.]
MAVVLRPEQIGQELLFCLLLGAVLGAARALFPTRGRGAAVPDFLLVGLLLILLQSYAAGQSFAGALRWYMLLGGALGAGLACALLRPPVQAAEHVLGWLAAAPAHFLAVHLFCPAAQAHSRRRLQAKERRKAKRAAKNAKKNLQNQARLLYNSNETCKRPQGEETLQGAAGSRRTGGRARPFKGRRFHGGK